MAGIEEEDEESRWYTGAITGEHLRENAWIPENGATRQ